VSFWFCGARERESCICIVDMLLDMFLIDISNKNIGLSRSFSSLSEKSLFRSNLCQLKEPYFAERRDR
jgi:hypothetical protein